MTAKYVKDFEFPSDFGFSKSATPVHRALGGPAIQQPRQQLPQPRQVTVPPPAQEATITMPISAAQRMAQGIAQVGMAHGAQIAKTQMPGPTPQTGAAPMGALSQAGMKKGGRLTTKQRHALPEGDFALPGERYPINDPNHARNALARVAQNGTPAEQATVRAKVHRKYPNIGKK